MAILIWQWLYDRKSFFGGVKLIKNSDPKRYSYSGFSISFDVPNGTFVKKVAIFGAEMSSSVHIDNKKRRAIFLLVTSH